MAIITITSVASGDWSAPATWDTYKTGQTADSGTQTTIVDASRAEATGYWISAILTVTAGTNVGEVRTITAFSGTTLTWVGNMPSACDATTVYKLEMVPNSDQTYPSPLYLHKVVIDTGHVIALDGDYAIGSQEWTSSVYALVIKGSKYIPAASVTTPYTADSGSSTSLVDASALTQADNYWVGGELTIVSGTNAGQRRLVNASSQSGTSVSWASAMPSDIDNTSTYTIDVHGVLVWKNASGGTGNVTLTVMGHIQLFDSGCMFIGTNPNNQPVYIDTGVSQGRVPAKRVFGLHFHNPATVASPNYYQFNYADTTGTAYKRCNVEFWGAEEYQSNSDRATNGAVTIPESSGASTFAIPSKTTLTNTTSGKLDQAANYWVGALLEITSGPNNGEFREITSSSGVPDRSISWSADEPLPMPITTGTTYTVKQNFQRAKLVSLSGTGNKTVTVDRAANWQVNDWIVFGGGLTEASGGAAERRQIVTRNSDTEFVIDSSLSNTHIAGDFLFNEARNVFVDSVTSTPTAVTQGFAFYISDSGSKITFKSDSAAFLNCGATSSTSVGVIQLSSSTATPFPIIRNTVFRGIDYATSPNYYVIIGQFGSIAEDYPLDNVHVYHFNSFFTRSTGITADAGPYLRFRNITLIEKSASGGVFVGASGLCASTLINVWFDGATRAGAGSGGTFATFDHNITCFALRKFAIDAITHAKTFATMQTAGMFYIKNGTIFLTTSGAGITVAETVNRLVIENVRFSDIDDSGIEFPAAAGMYNGVLFLKNCRFDKCNDGNTAGVGAILFTDGKGPLVYDMDSQYGVTTANKKNNIVVDEGICSEDAGGYISEHCKYYTPSTHNGLTVPISTSTSGGGTGSIGSVRTRSTFEFNNAAIDDSTYHHTGALVNGGGLVEINPSDLPGSMPGTSNIKMKITPYAATGRTHGNIRLPILLNLTSGVAKIISIYLQTNLAQAEGRRPALHVWGAGHHVMQEMSGAANSWEEVTITITPEYTGPVLVWVSGMNSLASATSSDGEPSARDTVKVWADGFSVTTV